MNAQVYTPEANATLPSPYTQTPPESSPSLSLGSLFNCFTSLESSILSFVHFNTHLDQQTEMLKKISLELQSIEDDVAKSARFLTQDSPHRKYKILKLKRTKSRKFMDRVFGSCAEFEDEIFAQKSSAALSGGVGPCAGAPRPSRS